jgi:hypothetical protein
VRGSASGLKRIYGLAAIVTAVMAIVAPVIMMSMSIETRDTMLSPAVAMRGVILVVVDDRSHRLMHHDMMSGRLEPAITKRESYRDISACGLTNCQKRHREESCKTTCL